METWELEENLLKVDEAQEAQWGALREVRPLASWAPTCRLGDCPSGMAAHAKATSWRSRPHVCILPQEGGRTAPGSCRDHFLLHLLGHTREECGNPYEAEGRGH